MTNAEMIKKFYLTVATLNGQEGIRIGCGKPTAKELEYIKAHKEEIKTELKAAKEAARIEAEETKKATFEFTLFGWEAHKTSIDTRKDIDQQLTNIAKYYGLKIEAVKEDYLAAIKATEEKAIKAESKKNAEEARAQQVFATAKATGTKQILNQITVDCDGSVLDCSTDTLVTYAMPDGSTTTVRYHRH
ncbi:hypothetical protein EOM81_08335 [bacterium]|nr:hypothetical protein [bacterium]